MKEIDFATFEQANRLKNLGFNEPTITFFDSNVSMPLFCGHQGAKDFNLLGHISRPTKTQAFRFFREKWLFGKVEPLPTGKFEVAIKKQYHNNEIKDILSDERFDTYEQAEDALIDALLEMVEVLKENFAKSSTKL